MSVAEDSSLTRSYVVLLLTADALNARTMWEWNGHKKIVLMSFQSPIITDGMRTPSKSFLYPLNLVRVAIPCTYRTVLVIQFMDSVRD